jgi:hypothetical protein
VVEQAAVNRLVAGSNPARGAISILTKQAKINLCSLFVFINAPTTKLWSVSNIFNIN